MTFFLYLSVIFVTGASSLVYQVAWQRYLGILVGSEARSATMVIAVFLLGLSIGYYLFGLLSTKVKHRKSLLKIYGYAELATGAYAICFPKIFKFFLESDIIATDNFFVSLLITCSVLLLPTILMGATVPIMTSVLPDRNEYVNRGHAVIYGVNTLGAFFGVVIAGFVLVNEFGLDLTLTLVGAINALVAVVYIFNPLEGYVVKHDDLTVIEQRLSNKELYGYAFISGMIVLGLEIVWIRILGLTLGSSLIIFPLVLGVFILGIGGASLSLKVMSKNGLVRNLLFALVALVINFILIPYLPSFAQYMRATFSDMPHVFYLYYIVCFILLCALLLPIIVPLGRVLPLTYSYLRKTKEHYGYQCGLLYFYNTVGTFIGSVFLGYFLLHFVDLDTVYRLIIVIVGISISYILFRSKKFVTGGLIAVSLLSIFFIQWDRSDHMVGMFRHGAIKGLQMGKKVENGRFSSLYFTDGPGVSVGVTEPFHPSGASKSIMVNGKSDSNTLFDYSTISLAGLLPVIYNQNSSSMTAAVVGLGTGVTAGLLGALPMIDAVTVAEISSKVVEVQPMFKEANYDLSNNPKVAIVQSDAFTFFKSKINAFDIVISEPTNPWTVGVENLFTKHFYSIAKKSLKPGGTFLQWLQSYSTDRSIFINVLRNVKSEFKHVILYRTHVSDYALVASNKKLTPRNLQQVFGSSVGREVFNQMNLQKAEELLFHLKYDEGVINLAALERPDFEHTITSPKLSQRSFKNFFYGHKFDLNRLVDPYLSRLTIQPDLSSQQSIVRAVSKRDLFKKKCKLESELIYFNIHCLQWDMVQLYLLYNKVGASDLEKLSVYHVLRKDNFIPKNLKLIRRVLGRLTTEKNFSFNIFDAALKELLKEAEILDSWKYYKLAVDKKLISSSDATKLQRLIDRVRFVQARFHKVQSITQH